MHSPNWEQSVFEQWQQQSVGWSNGDELRLMPIGQQLKVDGIDRLHDGLECSGCFVIVPTG